MVLLFNINGYHLIIILSLLLIQSIEEKIVSQEFDNLFNSYQTFAVYHKQYDGVNFIINMGLNYTWREITFNPVKTENVEIKHNFTIDSIKVYGEVSNCDFKLLPADISIPNFTFYYSYANKKTSSASIGFASHFDKEDFSVVHQLKKNNMIDRASFGFGEIIDNRGRLFFGGIPIKHIQNKEKGSCTISQGYMTWGCSLLQVSTDKYIYDNKEGYAYFDSNIKRIIAPNEFMKEMETKVFNKYLKEGICEYLEGGFTKSIECECDSMKNFPSITFNFGTFEITLNQTQLFSSIFRLCFFNIEGHNESNWVIGNSFFSQFYSLFDYEDNTITFYADKTQMKSFSQKSSNIMLKHIMIYNSIILLVSIIFTLITKY